MRVDLADGGVANASVVPVDLDCAWPSEDWALEIQHEAFLGLSPECRESHAFFRRLLRASGARAGPYDSQLSRVLDFHDR